MPDATTRLVEDLVAALNSQDLERVAGYYSPDFVGADAGQRNPERGRAQVIRSFEHLLQGFPDAVFTINSIVDGGREVALVWTVRGTHRGTFFNVPRTERQVEMLGISVLEFDEGLIVRGQRLWDIAGFLRSVRLLPDLPAS